MLLHTILSLLIALQGVFGCQEYYEYAPNDVTSGERIPCSVCGNSSLPLVVKYHTISTKGTANPRKVPWHASIYSKQPRGWSLLCGGTLVTSRAVLTAASCLTLNDATSIMKPKHLRVVLGKFNIFWNVTSEKEIRTQVIEIKLHPNYKGSSSNFENDIALIVLDTKVSYTEFVSPACIDNELKKLPPYEEDDLGISTGYGFAKDLWETGREVSSSLMYTSVKIMDYNQCRDIHKTYGHASKALLTSDKFCIAKDPDSPIKRINGGDGVTVYNKGLHYLVGVSSTRLTFSETEPQLNRFGTVSNVTYHMKWIMENLPYDRFLY